MGMYLSTVSVYVEGKDWMRSYACFFVTTFEIRKVRTSHAKDKKNR